MSRVGGKDNRDGRAARLTSVALVPAFSPAAHLVGLVGLLAAAACDLERRRVPDLVVLPAAVVAVLLRVATTGVHWLAPVAPLAGSLVVLVAREVTDGGIGAGDVKLAALPGAALGAVGALVTLLVATLLAGAWLAAAWLAGGRLPGREREPVAFAPFVAAGYAATALIVQAIA